MNTPCTYNLDSVYSIDSSSYMSRSGFLRGIEEAWAACVKKIYEEFDASFYHNLVISQLWSCIRCPILIFFI